MFEKSYPCFCRLIKVPSIFRESEPLEQLNKYFSFGSNLFKTVSKALTYAEVEPKISQILLRNSFGKKIEELSTELRKDAKIIIK